jgi:hypothetical protein
MSRVIEAFVWKHESGLTASTRGACPWHGEADKPNWKMVNVGWTLLHEDGTTGIGKPPFKTAEEAQAWADAHPKFRGWGSQG